MRILFITYSMSMTSTWLFFIQHKNQISYPTPMHYTSLPLYPTTPHPHQGYTHMNTDPYTLYAQGKITCAQFARMLRHELMVMRIAHECRIEDKKISPHAIKTNGLIKRRKLFYEKFWKGSLSSSESLIEFRVYLVQKSCQTHAQDHPPIGK